MADIRHVLHIAASPAAVLEAVATPSRWWSPRVDGEGEPGGRLTLHFGHWEGRTEVCEVERVPERRLVWEVTQNNEGTEWPGTRICFDLEPDGNGTLLRFGHCGWSEASDYFAECNVFWGHFMLRLKRCAETGRETSR